MDKSLDILSLHEKFRSREWKVVDYISNCLANIAQKDLHIGAFLSINEDAVLKRASDLDKQFDLGDPMPILSGIPVGIKDNICVSGSPMTCGSKMLKNYRPPQDATVVTRLYEQGAIPFGKLNMDEFAMGSSNENSAFFSVSNPWSYDHVPGGSSGGSAACVSAGFLPISLGSDTGGSIRGPAAYCGVLGLKPTYGRVSRSGLVAFASSLDQIGPFSKHTKDLAIVMEAISGWDALDATSCDHIVPSFLKSLNPDIVGKRIAIPKRFLEHKLLDAEVRDCVSQSIKIFEEMGATCDFVDIMDCIDLGLAAYYVIAPAEASSNLSRFDGVRYTERSDEATLHAMIGKTRDDYFGSEVKRRILLGTFVLSSGYYDAYYVKAQKVRSMIRKAFLDILDTYDVILSPTTFSPAFLKGEKSEKSPISMYKEDSLTILQSLAGLPALSIPCGFSKKGLPIAVQLTSNFFQEQVLMDFSLAFESKTTFYEMFPEDES